MILDRTRTVLGITLAMCLLISRGAAAEERSAQALMRKVFDQVKISFVAKMKLSSRDGLEQILNVSHKQFPRANATYMEVTQPFSMKDTRFLSWDRDDSADEHYTYVPMVKRSVQVADWTLKSSFLGSTFYMIDIAVPDMDEYEYDFNGKSQAGETCIGVEAAVKQTEDEPYSRIDYCVDEEKLLSVRTEFFDPQGGLLKVWRADKLEKVDGVWTPILQTMTDVQAQTESQLEILEIQMHVEPPDKVFRKAYLDR
jgi:hypothetical protein